MANKMLIDATHPEETRVVVLRGNRVEEFDFETAHRKQLRGNIYLAKVTRVEPSLQAAFVEYGGNRHGFLAFSEIHPDYYQIPVADRQALLEADAREAHESDSEDDHPRERGGRRHRGRRRHHERQPSARHDETVQSEPLAGDAGLNGDAAHDAHSGDETAHGAAEFSADDHAPHEPVTEAHDEASSESDERAEQPPFEAAPAPSGEHASAPAAEPATEHHAEDYHPADPADAPYEAAPMAEGEVHAAGETGEQPADHGDEHEGEGHDTNGHGEEANGHGEEEEEVVESVGGSDAMEEMPARAPRYRRQYKIQEVIKRRQVMLVQVVKEERGTKGAALTTYLSLAGRYCVLMPNTARGGGISRKITSIDDRKKLREIAEELEVPEGMGVILRTAGAARTKPEVKRDFEYLLRQWELVRDLTLKSTAPTLVYEEGSLAKRSIRDLYAKDIDEIVVAGDQGYRDAKEFMRMLMPSHAKNVKLYHDSQPIFTRYGIESQLDAMFSPTVQLRSGGYIVLNQTEALVAIDVNSGRSTREHHIEDTALKTNIEAAEEIARQLRLRDLAGLIVIDFIDMDEKRNNRTVERRLKDALRNDRARIQVGRISHFGLMEMSRQRIRTSVLESSTEKCPHCGGSGHVRSVSSVALQLLRAVEEMLLKGPTHNLIVRTRPEIALYVLNHKRAHLRELEERFKVSLTVSADEEVGGQTGFVIDRGEQVMTPEQARIVLAQAAQSAPAVIEEEEPEGETFEETEEEGAEVGGEQAAAFEASDHIAEVGDDMDSAPDEAGAENGRNGDMPREGGRGRKRRRRRGRGGRGGEGREGVPHREHGGFERAEGGHDQPQPFAPEGAEFAAGEMAPEQSFGQPHREGGEAGNGHGEGNGEQRGRRRRGRRGGRRNRRDQTNGDFTAMQETHGRPDYNERPDWVPPRESDESSSAVAPPPPPQHFEQPAPQPMAAAPAPAAEPPRRRSTVREPAPVTGLSSAPAATPMSAPEPTPPPAPVVSSPVDDAAKPRRTGWWAKRLLGGDKG
jgi:ribonuclease E